MSITSLRSKEVVTRKQYQCEWCGEAIEKGDFAESRTYVYDGEMISSHQHPECYLAMQTVENWKLEDGWSPGDFVRGSGEDR